MSPIASSRRYSLMRRDGPTVGNRSESRFCLAACLLAVPVLAIGAEWQTPAMSAADVHARQGGADSVLVVDVRPNAEYKSGHIAGAVNIPHTKLEKRLDELRQAENGIVLYCTMGKRTRQAEQTLLDHAIPKVYHLEGGLGAWRQGGYPVHTGWGP